MKPLKIVKVSQSSLPDIPCAFLEDGSEKLELIVSITSTDLLSTTVLRIEIAITIS